MVGQWLLYGSTGYTGDLTARLAVESGLRPVLAGRNAEKVTAQAAELGLEARIFSLDDPQAVDRGLQGMQVVLHSAGPYASTSRPMADACLRQKVHYLDLTGEIPVYESLARRDGEARQQGVMLLPGAGFDVVPTDCLALHLKERLPSARRLTLAFAMSGGAGFSRGTAKSMVEMLPLGVLVRRGGALVPAPNPAKTRLVDFGRGPRRAGLVPWGDVSMAYHSTGIPNIEDYSPLGLVLPNLLRFYRVTSRLLGPQRLRAVLRRLIDSRPPGPTPEQRRRSRTYVWGEVVDNQGGRAVARLHGPEAGYTWTPQIALAIVRRVLAGEASPGFQTPARAYGPDFILETNPDVAREDIGD